MVGVFRHSATRSPRARHRSRPGALALRRALRAGWRETDRRRADRRGRALGAAASVGEVTASARLVARLRAAAIGCCSATRPDRAGAVRQLHPGIAHARAARHPWCVDAVMRRAPARARARRTEIWPVWIAACERQDVPVVISGRISDRSLPRYRGAALGRRALGASPRSRAHRADRGASSARRCAGRGHRDLKLDRPTRRGCRRDLPRGSRRTARDRGQHARGQGDALLDSAHGRRRGGGRRDSRAAPSAAPEVVALARRSGRRSRCAAARRQAARGRDVGVLDTLGSSARSTRAAIRSSAARSCRSAGCNLLDRLRPASPQCAATSSRTCGMRRRSRRVGAGVATNRALAAVIGAALRSRRRARGARGRRGARHTAAAASGRRRYRDRDRCAARAGEGTSVSPRWLSEARRVAGAPARAHAAGRGELGRGGAAWLPPRDLGRGLARPAARATRVVSVGNLVVGGGEDAARRGCRATGRRGQGRAREPGYGRSGGSRSGRCRTAGCPGSAATRATADAARGRPACRSLVGRDHGAHRPARAAMFGARCSCSTA